MKNIALRGFSKLHFFDPQLLLQRLREIEWELAATPTPDRVRHLRTNELKEFRELREAAIFSFFIGERIGAPVGLAPGESQDYDFVASWVAQDQVCYAPVQLKELPPAGISPAASLDNIIASLSRYVSSQELVVAIHLNREIRLDPSTLVIPPLPIAELWLFWATAPDQNSWALCGNLLGSPSITYHSYPAL